MPIVRAANTVRSHCHGDASCPVTNCGVKFGAFDDSRPVFTDDQGRPDCDAHARELDGDTFTKILGDYRGSQKLYGRLVKAGAMTLEAVRGLCASTPFQSNR